jgi:hypothetical protein
MSWFIDTLIFVRHLCDNLSMGIRVDSSEPSPLICWPLKMASMREARIEDGMSLTMGLLFSVWGCNENERFIM